MWGNGHIWREEWGTDFKSLHLTKDMLDINLAGWHQHEMWGFDFVGSPP